MRDVDRAQLVGSARIRRVSGFTLLELMFVVGVAAVVSAATIPQALVSIERSRAKAATRYLSSRMAVARALAVTRGTTVALRFDTAIAGVPFTTFIDGNRNGVLTRDILSGADRQVGSPVRLDDLFAHVSIALAVPGSGTNPVQLSGGSTLLSFTAIGTATAGSVYVRGRDGSQFAIRVLGPTARTRLQEYDDLHHVWIDTR